MDFSPRGLSRIVEFPKRYINPEPLVLDSRTSVLWFQVVGMHKQVTNNFDKCLLGKFEM
jgi:hypothetical protein